MTGGAALRARRPALAFDRVSKRFPKGRSATAPVDAVVDVSFSVAPEEIVGIIGPNGAGKSTLLKLAIGITPPSTGRVRRRGHALGVIELGAGMHPDLTGRENIEMLRSLSTRPGDAPGSRFDEIVEFAELEAAIDEPVRRYSTGMAARLAFAVATHSEPDLLLLDEVLSVGDLSFQRRCRDRIHELRDDGAAIIVVSHDLELVAETCERAMLVTHGRVELDGPTDAVVRHYQGLPFGARDRALALEVADAAIQVGTTIEATIVVPPALDIAGLRLELVTYPPQIAALGLSIVIGADHIETAATGPMDLSLPTEHLPAGRYELHVAVEDSEHRVLATDACPLTITGPAGPTVIRLRDRVALDGVDLTGRSW
jgi:ABC-type polysaccharide/polyol phosphate transport system ATPase subunit